MEELIIKLKMVLRNDSKMVPYFIENDKYIHRSCFDKSEYLFAIISKLVDIEIFSTRKIKLLSDRFNVILGEMSIIEPMISIIYMDYMSEMIQYYFDFCKRQELYEVCINIKNFYEECFKIKIIDENEE